MEFRAELEESLTLKFAEAAAQRRRDGKEILSLGLGEPDFPVPPAIVEATVEALRSGRSDGYSSPMGLQGLRERIAGRLRADNGIPAQAGNILVTAGAKQALQMGLWALLEPGDEVIVLNPSFVSFIPQVYIAEPRATVRVVDVGREGFGLPLDAVRDALTQRTKAVIVNSPNNPAGYVFGRDELEALYAMAQDRGFYVFSDEIYEKLVFPGTEHFSIGSLEDRVERVFTVNGYSKSHAMTGWRLGYLCFPEAFASKLAKLQQHVNTNTCTFVQQAALTAFDMDMSFLEEYAATLQRRARRLVEVVNTSAALSVAMPSAGFFAFVDLSATGFDSNTFCSRLIEATGVATTPGLAFGAGWDDHVRVSYAVEDGVLDEGLRRMVDFVESVGRTP